MKKLITPGRLIFAAGIAGLGIFQFIIGQYMVGRPPEAKDSFQGGHTWAYITGALLIISALLVAINKRGGIGAFAIASIIFICSFFARHLPSMIGSTWEGALWGSLNAYKTLALGGGALIVCAALYREEKRNFSVVFTNGRMITVGIIFLSIFLLLCGISHFKFNEFVQMYIPAYVPAHAFWSYFTGVALLAGAAGILLPFTRKWAALLSGIMILCWFFLLHIPHVVATPADNSEWCGVFESFTFSGIFFVLAGLSSKND